MHCFNLTVRYAALPKLGALYPECVHYRLNWAEKGVLPVNTRLLPLLLPSTKTSMLPSIMFWTHFFQKQSGKKTACQSDTLSQSLTMTVLKSITGPVRQRWASPSRRVNKNSTIL